MTKVITKEDDMKEEEKDDGPERHVGYVLEKALGDNAEGTCVYLPEAVGDALVEAGIARLATAEDMNEEEEEEEPMDNEEAPMVAQAASKLKGQVEKVAADAVTKAMATQKTKVTSVPVEMKQAVYKSNGAFIKDCIHLYLNPGDVRVKNKVVEWQKQAATAWEKRGVNKAILGINETTGSEGGFLVNPQFSPDVYVIPHGQIDLQEQCQAIEAQSNTYNQRYVNESSLANGSIFGGLNMTSTAEGAPFVSSLPAWNNVQLTLFKFAIFVYYTTEVLQDASYPLESELDEYTRKAFVYGLNTQIVQGGTLEGALNAPSLVTVTKSSNDVAWHTTPSLAITYADLASMWAAVYPDCQTSPKGMWLFHPSLANPLVQMTYTYGGSSPAWGIQYNAENGLSGNGAGVDGGTPYRIFGKPAYPCWAMSAPGVAGSIAYIDFNTFRLYRKPFRVEISKEFQFGVDQIAVRFVSRVDCKTIFRNKVTGVNGTQQFGPIVTVQGSGT